MLVIAAAWFQWGAVRTGYWVDLDVYVRGAKAVVARESLYDVSVHNLPFTYSPFAAMLFIPALALPAGVLRALFTIASLISYLAVVTILVRRLRIPALPAAIVAFGCLALEPYRFNLTLGQINLFLVLFIIMDCFLLKRAYRGWLIGVAAGIKIVPGIFVLYFVLKKDWPAAARAGAGFLLTVLVGWAGSPSASWRYWSGGFMNLSRWGDDTVAGILNQSLNGVWLRHIHEAHSSPVATLTLCGIGVGAGLVVARHRLTRNDDFGAVLAIALGSLLGSPISWSHHWVWISPTLIYLVARRRTAWAWIIGSCFWVGPLNSLGQPDFAAALTLSGAAQTIAAIYVMAGVVALAVTWRSGHPLPAKATILDPEPSPGPAELAVT